MPSPELLILRCFADRSRASVAEIAAATALPPAQVRALLVVLGRMRLVQGRQDPDTLHPRRVFMITSEGRRRADASDFRARDA